MGFLTLRPGDTDPDYFEDYTPEQHAYCDAHAEALSCEVSARFTCAECGRCLEDGEACPSHGLKAGQAPRAMTSAVHSHTETGFCPVCITPGGGCSFAV